MIRSLLLVLLLGSVQSLVAQRLLREPKKWSYASMDKSKPSMSTVLADFDRDGDLDLIIGSAASFGMNRYFLNTDHGSWKDVTKSMYKPPVKDESWDLQVADVDGDGDLDLFVANEVSQGVPMMLYLNDGKGTLVDVSKTHLPPRPYNYFRLSCARFADVDGDKDPDLILAQASGGSNVVYMENTGKGVFKNRTSASGIPFNRSLVLTIEAADFTGDGKIDIFFGGLSGPKLGLYQGDGKGKFKDVSRKAFPSYPYFSNWATSSKVVDIDKDGDLDLLIGFGIRSHLHIFINNGKGVFRAETAKRLPAQPPTYVQDVELADLDLDGDLDIFVADVIGGRGGSRNRVYENTGKGFFKDRTGQWFPAYLVDAPSGVGVGDLDQDGDPDLVLACIGGSQNHFFYNFTRQLYAPGSCTIGQNYILELTARAGSQAVLLLSLGKKRTDLGTLGSLGLDFKTLMVVPFPIQIPWGGMAKISLPIPTLNALKGQTLYTQAFHIDSKSRLGHRLGNLMADPIQ